jgi:hypothetical protein
MFAFIDGEVLMWPKGKTIEDAFFIGIRRRWVVQVKRSLRCSLDSLY